MLCKKNLNKLEEGKGASLIKHFMFFKKLNEMYAKRKYNKKL